MRNFKVAVCDDEPNELQQIPAALEAYNLSVKIHIRLQFLKRITG